MAGPRHERGYRRGLPGGRASRDRPGAGFGAPVDLSELVVGVGEADLEPLNLAEPSLTLGLGDAVVEVVAVLHDAVPLGRIGPVPAAP
jgi:hypothetical protein